MNIVMSKQKKLAFYILAKRNKYRQEYAHYV